MDKIHALSYPGNKSEGASYMQIINEFPKHDEFISFCGGSGIVEKYKLLAPGRNIVFELNPLTISKHWIYQAINNPPSFLQFLECSRNYYIIHHGSTINGI